MFLDDNFIFQFGPVFIVIVFVIVIGIFLFIAVKGISTWRTNNHSPQLKVYAEVVGKRSAVRGGGEHRTYNEYYVTFEVESGDRMEFKVRDSEYGLLAEGDRGDLSF